MALHKQNFANMPAAETNPIDCGGFPRRDTNVFLPDQYSGTLWTKRLHTR